MSSSSTILEALECDTSHGARSAHTTPNESILGSAGHGQPDEEDAAQHRVIVRNDPTAIEEGIKVLEVLADIVTSGTLQRVFEQWSHHGLEGHAGSFMAPVFLATTATELGGTEGRPLRLFELSHRLFGAASNDVDASQTVTLDDFIKCYTGANLRWETIGTILALAG